jgi:hypothetical protein
VGPRTRVLGPTGATKTFFGGRGEGGALLLPPVPWRRGLASPFFFLSKKSYKSTKPTGTEVVGGG